jgi:hypothetical protein
MARSIENRNLHLIFQKAFYHAYLQGLLLKPRPFFTLLFRFKLQEHSLEFLRPLNISEVTLKFVWPYYLQILQLFRLIAVSFILLIFLDSLMLRLNRLGVQFRLYKFDERKHQIYSYLNEK